MTKREKQLHGPCASMVMKEFGVPARQCRDEVIRLIAEIYDSERMAHCLIILSLRGFRPTRITARLEYFLRSNGIKRPQQYLKEWAARQEEEF